MSFDPRPRRQLLVALTAVTLVAAGGLWYLLLSPEQQESVRSGTEAVPGTNTTAPGGTTQNAGQSTAQSAAPTVAPQANIQTGGVAAVGGVGNGSAGATGSGPSGPQIVGGTHPAITQNIVQNTGGAGPTAGEQQGVRTGDSRTPAGGLSLGQPAGQAPQTQAPVGKNGASTETQQKTAIAAAPGPSCFTLSYSQKPASSADADDWTQHRNLLHVKHDGLNRKSACVRVDGTPVAYEWSKAGILFGPVAGPSSKVTVGFCVGKTTCSDDCSVPKDEFMTALGGAPAPTAKGKDGAGGKTAHWDPADSDGGKADAAAGVEEDMNRELADRIDLTIFDGWQAGGEHAACETAQRSGKKTGGREIASEN